MDALRVSSISSLIVGIVGLKLVYLRLALRVWPPKFYVGIRLRQPNNSIDTMKMFFVRALRPH